MVVVAQRLLGHGSPLREIRWIPFDFKGMYTRRDTYEGRLFPSVHPGERYRLPGSPPA